MVIQGYRMSRLIYKELIKTGPMGADSITRFPVSPIPGVIPRHVVEILKTGDTTFDCFQRFPGWKGFADEEHSLKGNNLSDVMNITLNNKSLSLHGFAPTGAASQVPANPATLPHGYYYLYLESNVSGLPGTDFYTVYLESGYAGAYYAGGQVDHYNANCNLINTVSWWGGLPAFFTFPNGSFLYYLEENGYPQSVLDTLLVS